jgi:hypothetical protein
MKLLFVYFVVVLVTWMSFASDVRELRRCVLIMLETHTVISSLIFRLDLILVLCLALTVMLCLSSLIYLTTSHMVLVNERTALCLYALDKVRVIIVVIIFRVGQVFL